MSQADEEFAAAGTGRKSNFSGLGGIAVAGSMAKMLKGRKSGVNMEYFERREERIELLKE